MRRSKSEAAETRAAVVDAAARMFRERGTARVSVAHVMGAVGMTVGGFYKHFESKDALVAEAIDTAACQLIRRLVEAVGAEADQGERFAKTLDVYLSEAHRRHPELGCPVAALACDAPHEGPIVRKAFGNALQRLINAVASSLPAREERATALHAVAAMVGAMILARATPDRALGKEITTSVQQALGPGARRRRRTG